MGEEPPPNRYTKMAAPDELQLWHTTFKTFDRDGGGDVDLRELGLMFRQLGQAPSEREMRLLIEEVDADGSGTIDFEEFCCLMLRQARATRTPAWLVELLPPDLDEDRHASMPSTAVLSNPQFEAAKTIQRRIKQQKKAATELVPGGGTFGEPPPPPPPPNRPQQAEELSRDLMLMVVDLLPSASHIKTAHIGGHGPLFGPFVAAELSWRLATSTRTRLTYLDLAFNSIGDEGAAALARTLRQNRHLLNLDLSGNDIGQRGANALMASLCMVQEGGKRPPLKILTLDDNRISAEMNATLQTQLLLNNLPLYMKSTLRRPAEGASAKEQPDAVKLSLASAGAAAADPSIDESVVGMELGEVPSCRLQEEWLGQSHVLPMRAQLVEANVRSLHLHMCPRFGDAALHTLLVAPTGSAGHGMRLLRLRLSSSATIGDGVANSIAAAVAQGSVLANLRGLALDDCAIRLEPSQAASPMGGFGGQPPSPLFARTQSMQASGGGMTKPAKTLGDALRKLAKLEQLDLSSNVLIKDEGAAELCHALLARNPPADAADAPEKSPLKVLHLGGTGAGNLTATACAEALQGGEAVCSLASLCVSGDVGDVGARALAAVLGEACPLRELYLGDKIGDMGVEALAGALGERIGELTAEHDDRHPKSPLEVLCLGGLVRGGVAITNRLEARGARLLAEAFRHNPNGNLRDLRLSGNSGLGGQAVLGLVASLPTVSKLRALHVEGCGLSKGDMQPLVDMMHEVWCLHELVLDRAAAVSKIPAAIHMLAHDPNAAHAPGSAPPGGDKGGGAAAGDEGGAAGAVKKPGLSKAGTAKKLGGGGWGSKPAAGKLLGLKQRMALGKLLEDNKAMGERRVESWRLSKSLEEVQWVFTSLCAGMPMETIEGGVARWDGEACGLFVSNLGLPQYRASFEFNLTGPALAKLQMASLSQLGVKSHADQKHIMASVRSLLSAYERRERVARANAMWSGLLGKGSGGLIEAVQAQVAKEEAEEREMEEAAASEAKAEAEAAEAARKKGAKEKPIIRTHGAPKRGPEPQPALGVHTFQRTLSPGRKGAASVAELDLRRLQKTMQARRGRGLTRWQQPLPMIEQKAGVQSVGSWPKRAASPTSLPYQTAAAHAPLARQANFAVAGSQLHSNTRELFRGLMHTLETFPDPSVISRGAPGGGRLISSASSGQLGGGGGTTMDGFAQGRGGGGGGGTAVGGTSPAAESMGGGGGRHSRSGCGARLDALSAPNNAAAHSHALHGACEAVIATRHCGPGACGYSTTSTTPTIYPPPPTPPPLPPPRSRSSASLDTKATHQQSMRTANMQPSASLAALPGGQRRAPASHGHPSKPSAPHGMLSSWSQGGQPSAPLPGGKASSKKERELQRTELALNDRLASASATLQSYKMATLDVAEGSPPMNASAGVIHTKSGSPERRSRPMHEESGQNFLGEVRSTHQPPVASFAPRSDAKLAVAGERLPSSNERLGLILSDLMR